MAKVKCPVCGKMIARDEAVNIGRRYCCKEHADAFRQEMASRKAKSESSKASKEGPQYRRLVQAICEAYDLSAPTGKILRQIQAYKRDFHFTYDGMRATLIYCLMWANPPVEVDPAFGIAFIPYRYNEAKDFFAELRSLEQEASAPQPSSRDRIVRINAEDFARARTHVPQLIDISQMR